MPRYSSTRKRVVRATRRKMVKRRVSATSAQNKLTWNRHPVPRRQNPRTWFPNIKQGFYNGPDRNLQPFPNMETFDFKYCTYFQLSGTTGGILGTIGHIQVADLHIPVSSQSGVTHRPLGVDQFSSRYKQYKVWSATVRIRLCQAQAATNYFALLPQSRNDTYVLGSEGPYEKIAEKPGIVIVLGEACTSGVSGTIVSQVGEMPTIERTYTVGQLDGITKGEWMADISNYAAGFGASPTFSPTLSIGVGDWNGGNASQMSALVDIVYHGYAFDRITDNASA
jgi:hypothetical protein